MIVINSDQKLLFCGTGNDICDDRDAADDDDDDYDDEDDVSEIFAITGGQYSSYI